MDTSQIFSQMLLLFALIALGFLAGKTRVLTAESNRHLTRLVLYITNPCTIVYSVLSGEAQLTIPELFMLTAIALAFFLALIALAHFVPRLLHVPQAHAGIYRFMTVFSNIGFMGFPVVRCVYGQGAVFYAAVFNLFFQFFAYTYGVRQVSRDTPLSFKMLLQPVILAALTAYLIYLTSARQAIVSCRPGRLLTDALGMVNGITSPLCMIVTGVGLSLVPLRRVLTNWRLYLLSIGKQILLPLAVYFLLSPLVGNPLILGICVIMAAMPIATSATLFCARYDGPGDVAASGVFLSTLLSVPTVPILMMILF